jgi:hypothetical protein
MVGFALLPYLHNSQHEVSMWVLAASRSGHGPWPMVNGFTTNFERSLLCKKRTQKERKKGMQPKGMGKQSELFHFDT